MCFLSIVAFIAGLRKEVIDSPDLRLDPLQLDDLKSAYRLLPDKTGQGADQFSPADFKSLPGSANQDVLDLL